LKLPEHEVDDAVGSPSIAQPGKRAAARPPAGAVAGEKTTNGGGGRGWIQAHHPSPGFGNELGVAGFLSGDDLSEYERDVSRDALVRRGTTRLGQNKVVLEHEFGQPVGPTHDASASADLAKDGGVQRFVAPDGHGKFNILGRHGPDKVEWVPTAGVQHEQNARPGTRRQGRGSETRVHRKAQGKDALGGDTLPDEDACGGFVGGHPPIGRSAVPGPVDGQRVGHDGDQGRSATGGRERLPTEKICVEGVSADHDLGAGRGSGEAGPDRTEKGCGQWLDWKEVERLVNAGPEPRRAVG
jgi:hypothetical protein